MIYSRQSVNCLVDKLNLKDRYMQFLPHIMGLVVMAVYVAHALNIESYLLIFLCLYVAMHLKLLFILLMIRRN